MILSVIKVTRGWESQNFCCHKGENCREYLLIFWTWNVQAFAHLFQAVSSWPNFNGYRFFLRWHMDQCHDLCCGNHASFVSHNFFSGAWWLKRLPHTWLTFPPGCRATLAHCTSTVPSLSSTILSLRTSSSAISTTSNTCVTLHASLTGLSKILWVCSSNDGAITFTNIRTLLSYSSLIFFAASLWPVL